jgi:transposase
MMGKKSPCEKKLFYYGIDLDQRVRPNHPLRVIASRIDFDFVSKEVCHLYGYNGNVSVPPPVILKLMFLLFFYDVGSERELMETVPERLDWLWFLGYDLDAEIPDHSVLSKARRRWGSEAFERFFVRVVRECVESGLVDGTKVHLDGSLVDANASTDSVMKGPPELIAALKRCYKGEEAKLEEGVEDSGDDEGGGKDDEDREGGAPGAKSRYKAINKGLVSRTDPEAPVVRRGKQAPRPRYKNHRAVDDAHGVITAMATTGGDVKENGLLLRLVAEHELHTGSRVRTAVGDNQYGTTENFRACAQRGIRSHMGDMSEGGKDKGCREGIFSEKDFVYDGSTDTYRCPAGETLYRRRHKKRRLAYEYAPGGKVCESCRLRAQCTRSASGRSVKRHKDHELVEAARAESHSGAARRDRRRRRHLMEGSFADAANNHGFKRSRWRGLVKQRIQDLLIGTVQNIRMLLRHRRRRQAGVMAQLQSSTSYRLCVSIGLPLAEIYASTHRIGLLAPFGAIP